MFQKIKPSEIFKRPKYLQHVVNLFSWSNAVSFPYGAKPCVFFIFYFLFCRQIKYKYKAKSCWWTAWDTQRFNNNCIIFMSLYLQNLEGAENYHLYMCCFSLIRALKVENYHSYVSAKCPNFCLEFVRNRVFRFTEISRKSGNSFSFQWLELPRTSAKSENPNEIKSVRKLNVWMFLQVMDVFLSVLELNKLLALWDIQWEIYKWQNCLSSTQLREDWSDFFGIKTPSTIFSAK